MENLKIKKILGFIVILIGIINCLFVIIFNDLNIQDLFKLLITITFLPLGTFLIMKNK